MFFEKRAYQVADVIDAADLATQLTDYTWTTCQAFRIGDLLFVNDSTGADGAQEYAVVRGGRLIESLTVSWMTKERLLSEIEGLLAGTMGGNYGATVVNTAHPKHCPRCA
jgi:hypothetical protein